MANYNTSEFRAGLKVMLDQDPCNMLEVDFVKPGKGQAFTRIKFRNLKTGRVLDRTFKSGESLPAADVMEMEMQYLYADNESWHFMVPDTYEQYVVNDAAMGEAKLWLKAQNYYSVTLWNDMPILVQPPHFVSLKIIETDPGLRGDTATAGSKKATLETGAIVRVPLFLNEGEMIKVDTRNGEYVSRDK